MVTKEELKHLGWLARIELSDSELSRYTAQIREIIKYLDKLDTMPVIDEKAEPVVARKKFSELRRDEPARNLDHDSDGEAGDVFGTKYRKDGYIKGPRMV